MSIEGQPDKLGEAVLAKNGSCEIVRTYYSHPHSDASIQVHGITGIEYAEDRVCIKPIAVIRVVDSKS